MQKDQKKVLILTGLAEVTQERRDDCGYDAERSNSTKWVQREQPANLLQIMVVHF